uniref:Small ribosomal subunit protein eS19 n=1 Tax=Candidatus Methanophaga sp. ANME-1 ERB7 TaxID=2759913 RepID=A0A7G9Z1T8_9EURY|nr:30S ribosomal protein S19e [Methanosarcinales archaeon ANME-1 ERB7]
MTTVYDVPPDKLTKSVGAKLKKNKAISTPKWSMDVKKGVSKELPPDDKDWWWVRCASVLRQLYINGPVGVSRLCTYYGSRARRGAKKGRFRAASGKIIREALSQLEQAEYVTKTKKGRKISPKGQSFLNDAAHELKNTQEQTKDVVEETAGVTNGE